MINQQAFYEAKLQFKTDSWDVFEARNQGENIVIIDTRTEEAYKQEHIPGAVNVPHHDINELTTAELSKDSLYVTCCDGIGCNASTKGALNMTKLGFTVKELIGGLDWWKCDGYQTEGLKKKRRQGNCLRMLI